MSDIRDLVESYYNDVYIEEDQLDEAGMDVFSTPAMKKAKTQQAANFYTNRPSNPAAPAFNRALASAKTNQDFQAARQKVSSDRAGVERIYGLKPGSLTQTSSSPNTRPLPAGTPNLKVRVAPPGGAGKTAPTRGIVGNDNRTAPSTPTAPKGDAMSQWAAANPKLAAAKAERDRTRGTSATTNPLMKDFKSNLPAPSTPSPTTTKTAFDLAKKGVDLSKK